jgi:lipopolysaccharide transport system ATP-binding protein
VPASAGSRPAIVPQSPERVATAPPTPVALRADGLGKRFQLSRSRLRPLLRRTWQGRDAGGDGGFWAVRAVSFDVDRGGSLGVIGRNGSGKSTLLRLLAGIALPTTGCVSSAARLASLLDLGVGFQALETGRQNAEGWLVLLGGMSRREARRAAVEVERFAGIGAYFDRPLRTCSAGMQLRVAFATATMLEPEVLVADEVLAVGDESFQRRCNRWFDRFLERGGTLVLCAHDLYQVQRLCERTLWLDAGEMRELGETRAVVRHYREATGSAPEGGGEAGEADAGAKHEVGQRAGLAFEVVDLRLLGPAGDEVRSIEEGASIAVVVEVLAPSAAPHVHVSFTRDDMVPVYGVSSDMEDVAPIHLGDGRYRFSIAFPEIALAPATYLLKAHALDETATRLYDTVAIRFDVVPGVGRPDGVPPGALVRMAGTWR